MRNKKGPERVGGLVDGFLRAKGLREHVLQAGVVEEWEERVGEAIARVTRAKEVQEGTLIVEVKSSAWLSELSLMRGEILRQVNEGRSEGRVDRIVFRLAEQ